MRAHAHVVGALFVLAGCSKVLCPDGSVEVKNRCLSLTSGVECSDSKVCVPRAHANAACASYTCDYTCDEGYADCNGDLGSSDSDGCEASFGSAATCGRCDNACSLSKAYCQTPNLACRDFSTVAASAIPGDVDTDVIDFAIDDQGGRYILRRVTFASGRDDYLVTAVRSDGTFEWNRSVCFFNPKASCYAYALTVRTGSELIVSGTFIGVDLDFGGTLASSRLAPDGVSPSFDIFLSAMRKSDGNTVGLRTFGSPYDEAARELATTPDGSLIMVGNFVRELDLGAGLMTSVSAQPNVYRDDVYAAWIRPLNAGAVAQHGPAGGPVAWSKSFGGPDEDRVSALAADQDAIVVGGYFGSSFSAQNVNVLTNAEGDGVFVILIDKSGQPRWARSLDTPGRDGSVDDISLGPQRAYVVGNATGRPYVWAVTREDQTDAWQRVPLTATGRTMSVTPETDGNVFVTGSFAGVLRDQGTAEYSSRDGHVFLARVSGTNGDVQWMRTLSGELEPRAITIDSLLRLNVAGRFQGPLDLGTGPIGRGDPDTTDLFFYSFTQ